MSPVIQRDPNIKFVALTQWFEESLQADYTNFIKVSVLHHHYENWVEHSTIWNRECLLAVPAFSKLLTVLLHASALRYSRGKQGGARGLYGVRLNNMEATNGKQAHAERIYTS